MQCSAADVCNRWIRSKGLEAERRAGRALFGGLAVLVGVLVAVSGGIGLPCSRSRNDDHVPSWKKPFSQTLASASSGSKSA